MKVKPYYLKRSLIVTNKLVHIYLVNTVVNFLNIVKFINLRCLNMKDTWINKLTLFHSLLLAIMGIVIFVFRYYINLEIYSSKFQMFLVTWLTLKIFGTNVHLIQITHNLDYIINYTSSWNFTFYCCKWNYRRHLFMYSFYNSVPKCWFETLFWRKNVTISFLKNCNFYCVNQYLLFFQHSNLPNSQ